MIKGTNTIGAPARADRLRQLAGQAENLGALATLADATLSRASADLQTLAQAARRLATALECEADTAEVNGALGGGQ
ncbi:MAG TPA: hypothetical protein VHP33_03295 [Polyangiaceae bacterium]|jgi:hypothetical protein|nr:hypothetical protein [Polyangiaceae bacterium]